MAEAALPYEEPGIVTILIQASFLLALNIVNTVLDNVFYCGLVGQVLIGMAWGTPGAKILSRQFEEVATQLGYLGLIGIVFEGGLSTSSKSVQSTLFLSSCVAITGIVLPIAFSFSLLALADASNLQAFAAGAALCSTSLGTTFSILKTTGLTNSRLGTVLTSAAMLDDVVGMIMVQVISNLGSGNQSIHATTVIRPIFVSVGFALILPLACRFLVKPIWIHHSSATTKAVDSCRGNRLVSESAVYFLLSTALLVGLVSAASYAGTSGLFAAYLAGACVTWFDSTLKHIRSPQASTSDRGSSSQSLGKAAEKAPKQSGSHRAARDGEQGVGDPATDKKGHDDDHINSATSSRLPTPPPEKDVRDKHQHDDVPTLGTAPPAQDTNSGVLTMYESFYGPAVERILKPFFFASIGFSIPITKMFQGSIIWRGFVYAILMTLGKLFCGAWLIRFARASTISGRTGPPSHAPNDEQQQQLQHRKQHGQNRTALTSLPRPKSLYPASLLGCAMVARGEIGFLISALAATNGIFNSSGDTNGSSSTNSSENLESDLYLIVTWAILLCTIVGPLALGILARRVKRLQARRTISGDAGGEDPLGIWGV
ncbi:hypothetical protein ABEF95_003440 [Exophiala dermatitidis]